MILISLQCCRELAVISVKNFSGILTVHGDGSWVCEKPGKHKVERHPDPVRNHLNDSVLINAEHCLNAVS